MRSYTIKVSDEKGLEVEERETDIILKEKTFSPVYCSSDPKMIAYHEWKVKSKVEVSKKNLLQIFQTVDFSKILKENLK